MKNKNFWIVWLIFLSLLGNCFLLTLNAQENKEEELSEHIEKVEVLPEEIVKNLSPDVNSQIAFFVKYFTNEKREVVERWFKRCGPFLPYFKVIFREENIPEDLIYLAMVESGCNPFAVSKAGAVGIWQFIEKTGKVYGLKIDFWIDERKDFVKSTYAAAKYLKKLYEIFGDWRLVVASYNAGEGRVLRALRAKNFIDYWKLMMSGSIPMETFAYLPQWLAITLIAKDPLKYGFTPLNETPWDYVEISVPGGLDLRVFALAGDIDLDTLKKLNAELRREFTPPGGTYPLKVPFSSAKKLSSNLKNLSLKEISLNTPMGKVSLWTLTEKEEIQEIPEENFFINSKSNRKEGKNINSQKKKSSTTSSKTKSKTQSRKKNLKKKR